MNKLEIMSNIIIQKLSKLKIDKSPGPDIIHPRVLREVTFQICSALKFIFDLSLSSGDLPEDGSVVS